MFIKLIKTTEDYENALERVDLLMRDDLSEMEHNELELLLHLIDVYEEKQFPIDLPTPIEAIKFKMEQLGLKQQDLVQYIGSKSRVSEVLNGKRELTLNMIRALHKGLNIPAEIFMQICEQKTA